MTPANSLIEALTLSPDNLPLRVMVVDALRGTGENKRALEYAAPTVERAAELSEPQSLIVANALLTGGQAEAALKVLRHDVPETNLLRSKAMLRLGHSDAARKAYDVAVEQNPTLQDPSFEAELAGNIRRIGTPNAAVSREPGETDDAQVVPIPTRFAERVTFDDVGGLEDVKKQIRRRIITPFQKPSLFEKFKRQAGGGILLYGPPGCGKTLLAKATAGECGAKFINVGISDVLTMWFGESERRLHAIFEHARSHAPSVLFFDEVEALGGKRQHVTDGTSAKLVSLLLTELDGFAYTNRNVLILAATNVPWAVDAAFRRPGRFDRVLFIPPPDKPAREAILRALLRGRPTASRLNLSGIAESTSAFSGADLKNLVETAVDAAIEDSMTAGHETPVTDKHLLSALGQVKPTISEWLTTARNYARYANDGGQYDEVLEFLAAHTQQ